MLSQLSSNPKRLGYRPVISPAREGPQTGEETHTRACRPVAEAAQEGGRQEHGVRGDHREREERQSEDDRDHGVLGRRDDFVISLTGDDGAYRSFSLHGSNSPAVTDIEVHDPLAAHRALLGELSDDLMHDVTAYLVTLQ